MQQVAAPQTVRGAQVYLDQHLPSSRFEARCALPDGEVAGQRNLRCSVWYRTYGVTHDQSLPNQRQPAHDRFCGVEHLAQPGLWPTTHGGERIGHTGGGNEMVWRRLNVGGTQDVRCVDEESGDTIGTRVPKDVVIPTRALDPGSVAAR